MIDAASFATKYTAFWNMATPTCEHFVRKINLSLYQRDTAPMASSETTDRAFLSEFGFSLFVERRWPSSVGKSEDEIAKIAKIDAERRIAPLIPKENKGAPATISSDQEKEVEEISQRLSQFFDFRESNMAPRPIFPGCGLIDHSEADIVYSKSLFEVKTVERGYRSNDIRQLITYCALNSLSKTFTVERIGAYNPRRGTYFDLHLDFVANEISGKSASNLFEDIHQAISSGGVSR